VYPLLKFVGAVEHDAAIYAWLDALRAGLGSMARRWFTTLRRSGDDVRELMHDGCPTVCVASAPFAYVNAFRAHVNVGFFHGASLPDPSGLLQGSGKYMRHVKIRPEAAVNEPALETLIASSYRDILARLDAE
jgi:hypothetical protein